MSHYRHSAESRLSISITSAIAMGEPWTARLVTNNNLRQHCHLIARTFRQPHPQTDLIREPFARLAKSVEMQCRLLTSVHPSQYPVIPVLVRVAAYSARWIRQPETWMGETSTDPRQIFHSLLRHLFAAWSVPSFFDNAWLVKGDLAYLEREWYCLLASGGSLRNAQGMPPSITSRALHLAMSAPTELTVRQALRWGQVMALGGSPELLAEVLQSRMVKDISNDEVWSRLLEKLVATRNFKPRHFGLISDTLLEMTLAGNLPRAKALVSLPLHDLIAYCRSYWKSIIKWIRADQPEWSRSDIDCRHLRYELHLMNTRQWARLPHCKPFEQVYQKKEHILRIRIHELTRQWQLVAEGKAMRHCVDSYGKSCMLGQSSIFSVRSEESVGETQTTTNILTIQVDRKSRKIVQIKGKYNRRVEIQQIPLLRKWANEMRLIL